MFLRVGLYVELKFHMLHSTKLQKHLLLLIENTIVSICLQILFDIRFDVGGIWEETHKWCMFPPEQGRRLSNTILQCSITFTFAFLKLSIGLVLMHISQTCPTCTLLQCSWLKFFNIVIDRVYTYRYLKFVKF